MNYFTAEMQLYQIGFQAPPPADDYSRFQRMEVLSACLSAVRAFCEVWFSIPPTLYFSLSLVNFGQLTRTILVVVKLCLFDAKDWDLSQVREMIHLSSVLEEMSSRMEEASIIFGREEDAGLPNPFAVSARNLRLAKSWYEAQLAASRVEADSHTEVNAIDAGSVLVGNQYDVWSEDPWRGLTTNWDMVL